MIKNIFDIPNPYDWGKPVVRVSEFAGREKEIEEIDSIFNDVTNGRCVNLAILGERASGKTSLLNIIKEKAFEKGAIVVKIDLTEKIVQSDMDLLVQIFDAIIEEGVSKGLLGGESSPYYSNWRMNIDAITPSNEDMSKNFLRIGNIYANAKKNGTSITLLPNIVQDDFKRILSDARNLEIPFIAVLFDEADLLTKNIGFLQFLRNIIQVLENFFVIIAGSPNLIELISEVFSPIERQFKKITISNFKNVVEVRECLYKPLESTDIRRHTIRNYIDFTVINDLYQRTKGNPYHIKLLAYYMFEEFKKNKENGPKFEISKIVLEKVFENIAENTKSNKRRIVNILKQCSLNELKSLGYLTSFIGITIHEACLISNAFKKINNEVLKDHGLNILNEYRKISALEIMNIKGETETSLDSLASNQNLWSNYSFVFMGDHLDYLYLDYFIQERLAKLINPAIDLKYEEMLLARAAASLGFKYIKAIESIFNKQPTPIFNLITDVEPSKDNDSNSFLGQVHKMMELIQSSKNEDHADAYKIGKESGIIDSLRYLLGGSASNILHFSLKYQGKSHFFRIYQPLIKGENEEFPNSFVIDENKIQEWMPENLIFNNFYGRDNEEDLLNYQIYIEQVQSLTFHPNTLKEILVLDLNERVEAMVDEIMVRNYDKALQIAETIVNVVKTKERLNSNAFLKLILDDINGAEVEIDEALEMSKNYDTGLFNKAYISYLKNNILKAEKEFKDLLKITKKLPIKDKEYLCLKVPLLSATLLKKISSPLDFDLFLKPDVELSIYCSLAILAALQNKEPAVNAHLKHCEAFTSYPHLLTRTKGWANYHLGKKEDAIKIIQNFLLHERDKLDSFMIEQLNNDLELMK